MKKTRIILAGLLSAGTAALVLFSFLFLSSRPVPDAKRNTAARGVRLEVRAGKDGITPIIRTFVLRHYSERSEGEKRKLEKYTGGRTEGEIPYIDLQSDPYIYLEFYKDGRIVVPDREPRIEIQSPPPYYRSDGRGRMIIQDKIKGCGEAECAYALPATSSLTAPDTVGYHLIKIYYTIDEEEYISFFSVYAGVSRELIPGNAIFLARIAQIASGLRMHLLN